MVGFGGIEGKVPLLNPSIAWMGVVSRNGFHAKVAELCAQTERKMANEAGFLRIVSQFLSVLLPLVGRIS
jgi:hypothetical protein